MNDDVIIGLVGIICALWSVAAAYAIWSGISMQKKAVRTLQQTSRFGRLLETAPAIPIIVKGDGRFEATDRFARWIGLDRKIEYISDLAADLEMHGEAGGLNEKDLTRFTENIRSTQKTGKSFSQALNLVGSGKKFLVKGSIADALIYPNGAALLWVFDATESVSQLEKLQKDADEAHSAFTALAGLIEESPFPMWHRSPNMQLTFVNKAYVKAVNSDSAVHIIEDGIELIDDNNAQSSLTVAQQAFESGETIERHVSATIGGKRKQVHVFDIPLGQTGIAGLAIDVQELADTRLEFDRFVDAQRDLLDNMSAAVAQFNADGQLIFVNLPFQRIFSFQANWVDEKQEFNRVLDKMRDVGRIPEVSDYQQWRTDKQNWFRASEAVQENWLLNDGTHLRVLAQPIPDGGLLLIFEDSTEQAQLSRSHDSLLRARTATFDNLFETVAVFAADGRLNLWNRQFVELWGLEEEILAQHPRIDELMRLLGDKLKKPSQISIVRELIRVSTAQREQRRTRITFNNGNIYQIATIPLPDGNALFTMLDITDSMQIEQALRERNEALIDADNIKDKFLSNMSYELRTPLTSISGFAELLSSGIAGPMNEQAAEYINAIIESTARLTGQINNILDFSQSEAGVLPMSKKAVDIRVLLDDSIQQNIDKIDKYNINIICEIDDNIGEILGDYSRLKQVIMHLIDNAITYSGHASDVIIRAEGSKSMVNIIISDNGPGMDHKVKNMAFDKFPHKDIKNINAQKSNGNKGLGLPLARELIEAHGGTMELISEKGQGTQVVIKLRR